VTTALLRSESDNDLKGWCDVCCTFVDIVAKKSKLFGFGFFSYNSKIDWFFTTTFVRRWSLAVDSKCGIS
jgi:hypothetical protein